MKDNAAKYIYCHCLLLSIIYHLLWGSCQKEIQRIKIVCLVRFLGEDFVVRFLASMISYPLVYLMKRTACLHYFPIEKKIKYYILSGTAATAIYCLKLKRHYSVTVLLTDVYFLVFYVVSTCCVGFLINLLYCHVFYMCQPSVIVCVWHAKIKDNLLTYIVKEVPGAEPAVHHRLILD